MSVLQKIGALGSVVDTRNPAVWLMDSMGTSATKSGVRVSTETAFGLATYYACIRNIAEDIAGLPFKVFRRLDPRGKESAPDHPLYPIIHDTPSVEMSSMTLWEIVLHWALGWGNGYAEIGRNNANQAEAMYPMHPSRVRVKRDRDTGVLFYEVRSDDGTMRPMRTADVLHIRGIGDEFYGYSVARIGSESLGRALATQEFSARFFGQGTTLAGVFKYPKTLGPDELANLRESWPKGLPSAHNPVFLEGGMEWQSIGVNPEDAQMLETMRFSVEDTARWFRMPLHKVQSMESSTFSNIEHQAREYVGDTLMPWIRRLESEVNRKLFSPGDRDRFFAEIVVRGLLRGDMTAQSSYFREMFNIGVFSVNEIRDLEDMNPIEGGDAHMTPLNMERIDDRKVADEPDQRKQQVAALGKAHARMFADVAERLAIKETKALQRAAKRCANTPSAFAEWAAVFYDEHRQHAIESMRPPSLAFGEVICMVYGKDALPANVADAIDDALASASVSGARELQQVAGRIEALRNASAVAAETLPGRIEAITYKVLELK